MWYFSQCISTVEVSNTSMLVIILHFYCKLFDECFNYFQRYVYDVHAIFHLSRWNSVLHCILSTERCSFWFFRLQTLETTQEYINPEILHFFGIHWIFYSCFSTYFPHTCSICPWKALEIVMFAGVIFGGWARSCRKLPSLNVTLKHTGFLSSFAEMPTLLSLLSLVFLLRMQLTFSGT